MRQPASVAVSHPGTQQAYETVAALQHAGMLREFVASVYWRGDASSQRAPYRHMPARLREQALAGLRKRWHARIDPALVTEIGAPFLAMRGVRMTLDRAGMRRYADIERLGDAWFDALAAQSIAASGATQVHSWEGTALRTFEAAKRAGMATVLDAPAAHEYNLAVDAAEASVYGMRAPARFGSKTRVREERELADYVVSPSPFVTRCVIEHGTAAAKIVEIPFGADTSVFHPADNARHPDAREDGRFVLLCAASINGRKGTRYLLQAWRELGLRDAELVLAGTPDAAGEALLREYAGCYRAVGHVPWHRLPALFRSASAFVLPSLAEGSALVTYMAMASGLPVVVTDAAGSVVTDGAEGFVVAPRDVAALKERIAWLSERRGYGVRMGAAGRRLMEERYTWRHYGERIAALHRAVRIDADPRAAVAAVALDVARERVEAAS